MPSKFGWNWTVPVSSRCGITRVNHHKSVCQHLQHKQTPTGAPSAKPQEPKAVETTLESELKPDSKARCRFSRGPAQAAFHAFEHAYESLQLPEKFHVHT